MTDLNSAVEAVARAMHESDGEHCWDLTHPGMQESLMEWAQAAIDAARPHIIAEYEATRAQATPSDEELEDAFWTGYYKFRYEDMADDPDAQMERLASAGIRAVRAALTAAPVPQVPIPKGWRLMSVNWVQSSLHSPGVRCYAAGIKRLDADEYDDATWGYHLTDPWEALAEACKAAGEVLGE